MSPILPFDIIALIIDIVGENEDTDLLKELALVSHSFLQFCNKHLFATVKLHNGSYRQPSSKKGFVKLLNSRPDVVKYIRKLTYKVAHYGCNDEDHLLTPILSNFLPTSHPILNCLTINTSHLDWNTLDSSLSSALLHLMHLPTINHIELSRIRNFPISSLTSCVNLHRLDLFNLDMREVNGSSSPEIVVQSEMIPKILGFHTQKSSLLMTKLLHAKRQDGRPAFDFTDLRRLVISLVHSEDEQNMRYLLQNTNLKLLNLLVTLNGSLAMRLHDILSPIASTLKVLDLTVYLHDLSRAGLCEGLEAMAVHNKLEVLSIALCIGYGDDVTEDSVGSILQNMERVLVKPGWSALRQVSFRVDISGFWRVSRESSARLSKALQSLPDKYLSQLSKLESVAFNYSARLV